MYQLSVLGKLSASETLWAILFQGRPRERHLDQEGNMRDYADVSQLVCLANLEAMNAEVIRQGIPQGKRLIMLNEIAIVQMRSLLGNPSTRG